MAVSQINVPYFRLLAAQPGFRSRVARTQAWLRARLRATDALSWSAGKDSMVLVHLCRTINPALPILCVDVGVPYHWSQDDADRLTAWCAAEGWDVRYFPWDKWGTTAAAITVDEAAYRKVIHAGQFADLEAWSTTHGYTRRVDGMRIAEHGARAIFLRRCRGETAKSLHPLWQWSTDEVWAYIVAHDLPWLSIYDHLGPQARNGLIGRNGSARGRLVYLKRFYPAAFRRACELFPARDYV